MEASPDTPVTPVLTPPLSPIKNPRLDRNGPPPPCARQLIFDEETQLISEEEYLNLKIQSLIEQIHKLQNEIDRLQEVKSNRKRSRFLMSHDR